MDKGFFRIWTNWIVFKRIWIKRTLDFKIMDFNRIRSKVQKEKKKLTDIGLLEIPWILDVKDFGRILDND